MRILVTILLSLVTCFGFGQQVNAPDPKAFTQSTSGQDASGFSLSGFNSTATLLCAIGLPTAPTGTTFYFTTTTGVTAATGYTMSGNKTRLAFTGTQANINTVLASMKVNTPATAGTIQISVSATVNPTGYFYNPTNGHFYRPISSGTTYSNAKLLSSQQTFKGQNGYLVTITSADEDNFVFNNVPQSSIWFALSDVAQEGYWRIDAGPENGTLIKTSNGQFAGNIQGQYNNWAPGEPNNAGNEDYAVTKWNGSQWNDLPNHVSCAYVIEFGTWTNPDDQTFTEFYNNSTLHSNGADLNLKALFNFNFGSNIDETKFSANLSKRNSSTSNWTGGSFVALNGLGRVTLTNQLDTAKILGSFKQHKLVFNNYDSTQLKTLYGSIVTVSDVYLAFKELANGGIFGNQTGNEFGYGIQFDNADVNDDDVFNEADCFDLLQDLTGKKPLVSEYNLDNTMKIILDTTYGQIGKSNWASFPSHLGNDWGFALQDGKTNYTYNLAVTWKGDVNLSHSATPPSNGITNASANFAEKVKTVTNLPTAEVVSELSNDSVYVDIRFNPGTINVVGTQFQLSYNNSILEFNKTEYKVSGTPTNYSANKGDYINLGSLNTDGSQITSATYRLLFKTKQKLNSVLGALSIASSEVVDKDGKSSTIKIQ